MRRIKPGWRRRAGAGSGDPFMSDVPLSDTSAAPPVRLRSSVHQSGHPRTGTHKSHPGGRHHLGESHRSVEVQKVRVRHNVIHRNSVAQSIPLRQPARSSSDTARTPWPVALGSSSGRLLTIHCRSAHAILAPLPGSCTTTDRALVEALETRAIHVAEPAPWATPPGFGDQSGPVRAQPQLVRRDDRPTFDVLVVTATA